MIPIYDEFNFLTGEMKTIDLEVFQEAMVGMRLTVVDESGTARKIFEGSEIETAGKTGTAEYCDEKAQAANRCQPGEWPAHAWYVGYAPYDDPEIAVVAFVYDGTEGSQVAGPIVREVIETYFQLKKVETPEGN